MENDFDEDESENNDEQDSEEDDGGSEDDETVDKPVHHQQEMVPILLDSPNYMYYVTSHDGICSVREINPNCEDK